MSGGIEFDVDSEPRLISKPAVSKLAEFVRNHSFGMIKDENQANYTLLGIVAVLIILSLYLFWSATSSGRDTTLSPAQKTTLLKAMDPGKSPLPSQSR